MSKQRDPKVSLFDILGCAKNCLEFTKDMTFGEFEKDGKTISAVQHQLMIIGEATKRIDENFRNLTPYTKEILFKLKETASAFTKFTGIRGI